MHQEAGILASSAEHLFTTLGRKPALPRYGQRMVKRLAARAGIEKDIHPHTLRHSFATDLYRETKDIRLTQKALGHANLSTTQIYTHLVDEDLEAALRSFRQAEAVAAWPSECDAHQIASTGLTAAKRGTSPV